MMASRWVKAAFLAIVGVVLLLYADRFVSDLRAASESSLDISFVWTWDLLRMLMWVLVAWLFVDAGLTLALSFSEHRHTLADVLHRMNRIETKLGIPPEKTPRETEDAEAKSEAVEEESARVEVEETPAPPPPRD